jgi:hypothetical protein
MILYISSWAAGSIELNKESDKEVDARKNNVWNTIWRVSTVFTSRWLQADGR